MSTYSSTSTTKTPMVDAPAPGKGVHTIQTSATIRVPSQLVATVMLILFIAWVTMLAKYKKNNS
jgi:hypothetical protein